MLTGTSGRIRVGLEVTGIVQGVGFRPFAHRIAEEAGVAGFARNAPGGAEIEIEGDPEAIARFIALLQDDAPALARIDAVTRRELPACGERSFTILESQRDGALRVVIPPDSATCPACLAEVRDPANRRYRHPFANCTQCGPRFTVIRELPYDRPRTTMASFQMCDACASEYADPTDRRFHAQPICCPDCGPRLEFRSRAGTAVAGTDEALAAVHEVWRREGIVAVKGIGGYHLTCDARSDAAVSLLRQRKARGDKPFALLVRDLQTAEQLVRLDAHEAAALSGPARPIVLARRRAGCEVSGFIAPGNPDLGVMLPYSPLHELLLCAVPGGAAAPGVIVATSGNLSGEPLCTDDSDALERLAPLADAFLLHDRPISAPCDDSVVRVVGSREQPVRRSRGFAPVPLDLPVELPATLAVGGELKATFCIAEGRRAWLSQHIGDVENLETLEALERGVAAFERMYEIAPEVLAADMHPGYLSRGWVRRRAGEKRLVEVQHHHAHAAALMAEHGLDGTCPIVAIVFDGTGYARSPAGAPCAWGGEILVADYDRFERVAHLAEMPLPGGDEGVRNPCRTAVAWLVAAGIGLDRRIPAVAACTAQELRVLERQALGGAGCVPTSSAGRLFDVAAAILGVCQRSSYEAQAAIELQALASRGEGAEPLDMGDRADQLDVPLMLRALVDAVLGGAERSRLALGFHVALAQAAAQRAAGAAEALACGEVGLTGGVFQNELLSGLVRARLEHLGLRVLEHERVPANDGGLALGQAIIAGRAAAREKGV